MTLTAMDVIGMLRIAATGGELKLGRREAQMLLDHIDGLAPALGVANQPGPIHRGYPGHFIGSNECLFHLHTVVGPYKISSVGDYRPRRRGEQLGEMTRIGGGPDALFETYVFEGDSLSEIDGLRAKTAEDCEENHRVFVTKYTAIAGREGGTDR